MAMTQSNEMTLSREVAEAARESEWKGAGFLRELFLGKLRLDLIHPYPLNGPERPEFQRFYADLEQFLREKVDPARIDETGEYPPEVVDGLRKLGAFGMKIPAEYGGLGLTQVEYGKAMQLVGSYDANLTALLSAHQSIGVPQPLKLFGTEEQKKKYLPRLAKGAISAFALTEVDVGSTRRRIDDPATPREDGSTTSSTARSSGAPTAPSPSCSWSWRGHPKDERPQADRLHRRGGLARRGGRAPLPVHGPQGDRERRHPLHERAGPEREPPRGRGHGLKLALITLNTGRLTAPAVVPAASPRRCLEIVAQVGRERVQWGQPIGKHEAIAHKIGRMAVDTFAMEAVADLAPRWPTGRATTSASRRRSRRCGTPRRLADRRRHAADPRRARLRDRRARSPRAASADRRRARDARLPHQPDLRGLVGDHAPLHGARGGGQAPQIAGALIDPKVLGAKAAALPKMAAFYALLVPRAVGGGSSPRATASSASSRRTSASSSARAASSRARSSTRWWSTRRSWSASRRSCSALVDIANELFAMAASVTRAQSMKEAGRPEAADAARLADHFCLATRRKVRALFDALWHNDDAKAYAMGREVLEGKRAWLQRGDRPRRHRRGAAPRAAGPRAGTAGRRRRGGRACAGLRRAAAGILRARCPRGRPRDARSGRTGVGVSAFGEEPRGEVRRPGRTRRGQRLPRRRARRALHLLAPPP